MADDRDQVDGVYDQPQNVGQEDQVLQLTKEEVAVLKECRFNSVFYRGIPLGLLSFVATRQVAKGNYIPFIARRSGLVSGIVTGIGFLLGVGSYRQTCLNKIMALDNSQLADQVRAFARSSGYGDQRLGSEFADDIPTRDSGNQPMMQEQESLLRRRSRPVTTSKPVAPDSSEQPTSSYTSYEELRRRHRATQNSPPYSPPKEPVVRTVEPEESSSDSSIPYSAPLPPEDEISYERSMNERQNSSRMDDHHQETKTKPLRRNKYGDEIE